MINVSKVQLDGDEMSLVEMVMSSGQLAQGPMVARFEEVFRAVSGTSNAAAVSSGTAALVLALRALGIGPGDRVLTTPFTFVATVNAILEVGASAHLIDIERDSFLMDIASIEDQISNDVRAVIPVHLYGQSCDMAPLNSLSEKYRFRIIEDAAQAHGATYRGQAVGSFDVGCFSFYATKNITTGEGGMVTSNDPGVIDDVKLLRNQGMRDRYDYVKNGSNYRMTDVQAAIGIAQVGKLETINKRRAKNAAILSSILHGTEGIVVPDVKPERTHVWHQYTIRVTDSAAVERDVLQEKLRALGVGSGVYYPMVISDYPAYADRRDVTYGSLENARVAAKQVLSLPIHPHLGELEMERIGEMVGEIITGR